MPTENKFEIQSFPQDLLTDPLLAMVYAGASKYDGILAIAQKYLPDMAESPEDEQIKAARELIEQALSMGAAAKMDPAEVEAYNRVNVRNEIQFDTIATSIETGFAQRFDPNSSYVLVEEVHAYISEAMAALGQKFDSVVVTALIQAGLTHWSIPVDFASYAKRDEVEASEISLMGHHIAELVSVAKYSDEDIYKERAVSGQITCEFDPIEIANGLRDYYTALIYAARLREPEPTPVPEQPMQHTYTPESQRPPGIMERFSTALRRSRRKR